MSATPDTLTAATIPTATARTAPRPDVVAYARLDLRRQLRDRMAMFFIVGLPMFMYLVFGLGSDDRVGSGNVAMYIMISMACYGAVTATTGIAGSAATEQMMGWGRQLGLTPMRPLAFVAAKAGIAMVVAAMPVTLIFAIGALTGARGSWSDWVLGAAIVWAGSALFAIYGLSVSLLFRGSNAPGIASGFIVVMAFLGGLFTPMSGLMLDIGRFTPLYGYAALARFPLTGGGLPLGGSDPLWLPVANVLAWTVIFSLLATWGVRRSRART
ncbi:ABC-2 type transport system permease protein [Nocardioides exalbidus]|uniref:ABC-2 type transport system permease protein n=1 Tax=Nocardioides exalbidus TaxID=402596 RepID=A0A1H4ML01_9ACTN|nr:ABC transporter permease [Nocardioides exalbidus]SEB83368.1 ABC-2 type transport system permease protein [Nocardioides exalbidus]